MVGHAEQRVGVRRQVDADDVGLLVEGDIDEARILMAEAVVFLMPDMARQQIIQRRDGPPPRNILARIQPFRMLVEHQIDDVNERLVAGEQAVPAGEEVAFQPALAGVLGEDFHNPAVAAEMDVFGKDRLHPRAFGDLEDVLQPVRGGLVRADDAEVFVRFRSAPSRRAGSRPSPLSIRPSRSPAARLRLA